MTDFDFYTLPELIDKLPATTDVREWAMRMLAARGDAHTDQYVPDGLKVEDCARMGEAPRVALEYVRGLAQGGMAITRRIEIAAYPNEEFDEPFWDYPERTYKDLRGNTRNEIELPHPLTQPLLVRRTEWWSQVDGWDGRPYRSNSEVVTYMLIELEPGLQRQIAENKLKNLANGIVTEADEWRAWLAGNLK